MKIRMTRRQVLRGIGGTVVALPFLESLADPKEARAGGGTDSFAIFFAPAFVKVMSTAGLPRPSTPTRASAMSSLVASAVFRTYSLSLRPGTAISTSPSAGLVSARRNSIFTCFGFSSGFSARAGADNPNTSPARPSALAACSWSWVRFWTYRNNRTE